MRIFLQASTFLLSLFLIVSAAGVAAAGRIISVQEIRYKAGDDLNWADPQLDDSSWTESHLALIPSHADVVWLRAKIKLTPEQKVEAHPTALFFSGLVSSEIFWDGVLIGRNGKPALTKELEVPGLIQKHYVVPAHLASIGEHVIAIRNSGHHRNFYAVASYYALLFGDYDTILSIGSISLVSLISLSGMMIIGLFAFILFLSDRHDRSYLVLSALGFTAAALLIGEAWRNLFGYPYNFHFYRLITVAALSAILNFLLLLFAIVRFPGKYASYFAGVLIVLMIGSLFVPGWDNKTLAIFIFGLTTSLIWNVRALVQKRRGSLLNVLGISATVIVLFWRPEIFADLTLYFALDFLLFCLLVANALQIRQLRSEREEALLKSARLEIELLKRHIQPHFLMNSLTALSEWIEEDPANASSMIHALAEEFKTLTDVSNKALIPMKDELRLCSSHLEIMSRRKGRQFVLQTSGVDPDSLMPPAVIHTLVENAITHARVSQPEVQLKLSAEKQNGRTKYIFQAPIGRPAVEKNGGNGTGLRYIRARLQESFGSNWEFKSGPQGDLWISEILIPSMRSS